MTRDEAIALAHAVGPDGMTAPAEWVIAAILRAAGAEPKRPEPTTSLGDLTVTMLNSGGLLFKVKGVGVGGRSVSAIAGPSVVAETLRDAADDLWPLPSPAVAMPGPSAPPWTAPNVGFQAACLGNLKIEATADGFDLVINAARTNRAPIRASFKWSMENEIGANTLRSAANSLCPEIKPADFTFSESKIDRAFAAAEWQFIASSFGLARAALKQAGYPDQQFEGAQVLASTKVDEIRRMGGKS